MQEPPLATTFALRDGREMTLRPLMPGDRVEHRAFVERLSRRSARQRFFVPVRTLEPKQQDLYFDLDWIDRVALVATFDGDARIYAVGRYARESNKAAEVAFVVDDGLHGCGIGRALLMRLASIARGHGITCFTAWVLADNLDMLGLFRGMGWPIQATIIGGLERVILEVPDAAASSTTEHQ